MDGKYKNQRYTLNDGKLSKYFLSKTSSNMEVPTIAKISEETGISFATISRYARRRGYYSFGEMRANFNKNIGSGKFDDHGMIDYLLNNNNIVIIASQFTQTLAHLLLSRLKELKYNVRLLNNSDESIQKNERVIAITLSGNSKIVHDFLDNNKTVKGVMITTVPVAEGKRKWPTLDTKVLSNFKYTNDDIFQGHKIIRQIFIWLDDLLNVLHIQKST